MTDNKIASARGQWYELGFNYGILCCIQAYADNGPQIYKLYSDGYTGACPFLHFNDLDAAANQYKQSYEPDDWITIEELKNQYEQAYLTGYDMAYSFMLNITGKSRKSLQFLSEKKGRPIGCDVVYMQIGLYQMYGQQNDDWVRDLQCSLLQEQFTLAGYPSISMPDLASRYFYQEKGQLFNADTLILFRTNKTNRGEIIGHRFSILVSDESAFTGDEMMLTDTPQDVCNQMKKQLMQQRMSSFFRNASITNKAEYNGMDFEKAARLATDKSLLKAIQAASYSVSFIDWITKNQILTINDKGIYNTLQFVTVCGMTNIDHAVVNLRQPTVAVIDALKAVSKVYTDNPKTDHPEKLRHQKQSLKIFSESGFKEQPDEEDWSIYTKKLTGFVNENNALKDQHASKFNEAMNDPDVRTIYACGAPGIGKTTCLERYADKCNSGIFGYNAPRNIIVSDFISKMSRAESGMLAYTTNSRKNKGAIDVQGDDASIQDAKRAAGEKFHLNIGSDSSETEIYKERDIIEPDTYNHGYNRHIPTDETVLERMSNFSGTMIKAQETGNAHNLSKLSPALSTQACGKCSKGNQNIYFKGLFGITAKDPEDKQAQKDLLAHTYQNLVWMADETSGDEHGIQIAKALQGVLNELHAENTHINTKFILADASMQDEKTTAIYSSGQLGETFFISRPEPEDCQAGVSYKHMKKNAVILQCNAYPAKSIDVTYKIAKSATGQADVTKKIVADISAWYETRKNTILHCSDGKERYPQYILFIQNKEIINQVEQECANRNITCEEVTSDTDAKLKRDMENRINRPDGAAVILMTSSGARGISFKYATTIACCVPTFQVPTNLMEIIQAIYRGRGDNLVDQQTVKHLIFYVDLTVKYKRGNADKDIQEIKQLHNDIDAMTMMLLIEASIETRIYGADQMTGYAVTPLGRQNVGNSNENWFNKIEQARERLLRTQKPHLAQLCEYAEPASGYNVTFPEAEKYINILDLLKKDADAIIASNGGISANTGVPDFIVSDGCIIFKIQNVSIKQTQSNPQNAIANCMDGTSFINECKQELENNKNDWDAFHELQKFVIQSADNFNNAFIAEDPDSPYSVYYLAIPLSALGKHWTNEDWKNVDDEDDIIDIMYQLLRLSFDVNVHIPRNAKQGFNGIPYLLFTSGDLTQKAGERFVNTEIVTSNSTNMLSLMFGNDCERERNA